MSTLLGHLAQFGSFFSQGEVLCTASLTYVLKSHAGAAAEFAAELLARTGVEIGAEVEWFAESRQTDGGRPDLEGRSAAGVPLVKVEAKLDAPLWAGQLLSYVQHLADARSPDSPGGILLVLVPSTRLAGAEVLVRSAFGVDGSSPWRAPAQPAVAMAVMSWEDLLSALARADSVDCQYDALQVQGLYTALCSYHIWPLSDPQELVDWRSRETDYVRLVERATRRLTKAHRTYPMAVEPVEPTPPGLDPKGYNRRYVCRAPGAHEPCFSIGVRDPFAGTSKATPIWLRFNGTTTGFADIRRRLDASVYANQQVLSGGSTWLPLTVPTGVDSEAMIDAIVRQAQAIVYIAYGLVTQSEVV